MHGEGSSGWLLRVVSGPAAGTVLPLGPGQTVLGRIVEPGDTNLKDDSISRRHAIVTVGPERASIADAGSTNGTFVDGRQIHDQAELREGSRIRLGESELVVSQPTVGSDAPGPATRRVTPQDREEALSTGETVADGASRRPEAAMQTILFTDVVESTKLAHSLGDDTAVRILGVHDRVVREAVREHGGREVKHTGDGIMAAFPSANRGVQAAIDIMRGIERHNDALPEPELQLRLGLNAGEPLVSGGDLYGLAVSLAARLCAAAEPGGIMASEAVRVLCLGKGKHFVERGARTFKGIETPVAVCEVIWTGDE